MDPDKRKVRVLFLPAWYPSTEKPVNALFIREHARAASLRNEVVVLYVYGDETVSPWRRCRTTEEVEDGIRTIRVKYGAYYPIAASLKRRIFRDRPSQSAEAFSGARGARVLRTLKAVLLIDEIVVGDLLYHWRVLSAFRMVLRSRQKPDVIHAHVFTAGVPAVILGRLYRIPVVLTEHWSAIPLRRLTFSQRLKARFAMGKATVVLPVSRFLEEAIQGYGIRSDFRVVPNAFDGQLFSEGSSLKRPREGGRKTIVSVTRLVSLKGVSCLLEALARVRAKRDDFELHLVGDGVGRQEYEEQSRRLGLAQSVTFHGSVPKPAVAELVRDSDFFVQSSLVETFGVVYIEAMACGKPVIACDIPGPNEFIGREMGVLVPPGDVVALADAIDFMLDHFVDYSSQKIAQYARERFSHEAIAGMLDRVYGDLLGA